MSEWMPILLGLGFGGLSILAPRRRLHRLYVCIGILFIALGAVLLSGEWQQNPMYLAFDLVEAFLGFAAGVLSIRFIRSTQLH